MSEALPRESSGTVAGGTVAGGTVAGGTVAGDDESLEDGARATSNRPSERQPHVLTSFSESRFGWLFASNTTFFLGLGGQHVLRAWLVFQLTGSEIALGLVSAAVAVPMLLVSPLGGVLADRVDRRRLVALGQGIVIASEGTILVLLVTGHLRFWHLLTSAAVLGLVFTFVMPARQAIVANVVGRARLTNAMALNMAAVNTTRIAGPAAAGVLIGTVGLPIAYGVNVALFCLALTCLMGVGSAPSEEGSRDASPLADLREGISFLGRDRLVLVLLFFGLVPMFLLMPFQNLLVVFAEEVWHVGAEGLGTMSAVAGLGGLVGAVLVAWRSRTTQRLRLMMSAVFGFGFFLIGFAHSPWYWLALPMIFVANVFANLFSTLNNTAVQVLIPDAVRGRVSSFLMMSFSLPLLGTLPVSIVAQLVGAPMAITVSAGVAVVVALAFYIASVPLRTLDERLRTALAPVGRPDQSLTRSNAKR